MKIHYERLMQLRELMRKNHIDYYMITTQDYHNSEYVHEYFKEREYISGFSGSNGTLLVSQTEAGLWTDGRYYLQAEEELKDSQIALYKQEPGVLTIEAFLDEKMTEGQCLGFCGQCVTAAYGEKLEKVCKKHNGTIKSDVDLPRLMWTAPEKPCSTIWILEDKYAGVGAKEKLSELRDWIKEKHGTYYFSSKLDDIMWLYNIRGNDVTCNPVALSYTLVGEKQAYLFVQEKAVTEKLREYLDAYNVTICEYEEVVSLIEKQDFSNEDKVLVNKKNLSYGLYRVLNENTTLIDEQNILESLKSIKNETESQNIEQAYLKDSAAICRFICWLKEAIGKETITEISAAEKLEGFRKEIPDFFELSFPTICGYKENAAIVHYEATELTNKKLEPEGMVLVDSGGQYLQGTTDNTRTIVLGKLTAEEKELYSAVAAGMLKLADAVFLEGCSGRNIDILAREVLWKKCLDYKHGTGHGIGFVLNVHEGPQNIRWSYAENMTEAVIRPGMIMSDEPGIYLSGKFGVRIENIVQAIPVEKNEYGNFLKFKMLTYVPLDLEALDSKYLTVEDINRINAYHDAVYEKMLPYMTSEKEKEWLRNATVPIDF